MKSIININNLIILKLQNLGLYLEEGIMNGYDRGLACFRQSI